MEELVTGEEHGILVQGPVLIDPVRADPVRQSLNYLLQRTVPVGPVRRTVLVDPVQRTVRVLIEVKGKVDDRVLQSVDMRTTFTISNFPLPW